MDFLHFNKKMKKTTKKVYKRLYAAIFAAFVFAIAEKWVTFLMETVAHMTNTSQEPTINKALHIFIITLLLYVSYYVGFQYVT